MRWCEEVFSSVNMIDAMIELYAETLIDLDPSIASCMDLSLKQQAQPLLLLLEYHQISSQFQKNLESLYIFNNGELFEARIVIDIARNELPSQSLIRR